MDDALKLIRLLCLAGTLIATGGCMSARVTTNLKPDTAPELKSSAGMFYVAGIKYVTDNAGQASRGAIDQDVEAQKNAYNDQFGRTLLTLVRKECVARYPGLFTDNSSSSIPLWVEVNHTTVTNDSRTLTWMLCTAMISGIIFPCPGDTNEKIELKTGVWNGQDGIHGISVQNSFQRYSEFWVSVFTPSALIPISGESDFPKISGTIFDVESQTRTYELITAQQIVTAIAKSVAGKDSGYWAAARPEPRKNAVQQVLPEAIAPAKNTIDPF